MIELMSNELSLLFLSSIGQCERGWLSWLSKHEGHQHHPYQHHHHHHHHQHLHLILVRGEKIPQLRRRGLKPLRERRGKD